MRQGSHGQLAAYLAAGGLLLPLLADCGGAGGSANVPRPPVCPDMTVDAIDRYDFAAEMKIQPPVSARLRPGIDAALTLSKLADEVDTSLRQACVAYLADLGVKGVDPRSADACPSLVRAIREARAKLGPEVVVAVEFLPPLCSASLDLETVCATQCDPNLTPDIAKPSCDPGALDGTCAADCMGTCDTTTPAGCKGSCTGTCDARIRGTCSDLCSGRCDGKPTKKGGSFCRGVCDGTCDSTVEGLCTGRCTGSCRITTASPCPGTCAGSCSSDWKTLACAGEVHAPRTSAECTAKCDAVVASGATCSGRPVVVRISGEADEADARAFKGAAEKNLPAFGRAAISLAERVPSLVAEASDVADEVTTLVRGSIANPIVAGQVAACFAKPFADIATAGASLQSNIELAIQVKAAMGNGGPGAPAVLMPARTK